MTRQGRRLFWGFWFALTLLWALTNLSDLQLTPFFAFRASAVQLTGVLAMGAMSLAMILALRLRAVETAVGGLDKVYRLHKWLGIGGLGLAALHWLWSQGPKWAVGLGWLERPHRGPRPEIADPLQAAFASLRGLAESVGEWAFYAASALIVIALVSAIPYRLFRLSHRLIAPAFLALAFHSVLLLDFDQWATPLGVVMAALIAGGVWAAILSLLGQIGAARRVAGRLAATRLHPGVHALEKTVTLPAWPGHRAGQFAFVTSDAREGAHPYTIASAWRPDAPDVTFIAKELGDHTTGLAARLKPGQPVTVEGPYGRFTFDLDAPDAPARQIWIGGGIGVTPFLARMQELARSPAETPRPIDLFHTTREVDEQALAMIEADARAAGIRLHILIDARDGFLTAERIRAAVPDWREASFWFCGPARFGQTLRADFQAQGLQEDRFHQELFAMR